MNRAQELQLLRLQMTTYNNLDGKKVASDLEKHEDLWASFVFGRFEYQPLIELRDLPQGSINADTVYVLTPRKKLSQLLDLVNDWKADELGWQTGNAQGGDVSGKSDFDMIGAFLGEDHAVVRIWWD